ncbi:MAG TPA: Cof-type HAD-IIB family hydrolase [Candidatus Dormibacteraeota bacterium]|nr:Cof-type HAD-IIB family hydrolase [Candidatus Dormibacteraeota bacterium]
MKLIATDLDGTLLNELGKVSTENAQAIKNALDQGIQVVVATGRAYEAAYLPLQEVGLSLPIICLNGAMTYTKNKELLKHIPMERDALQRIQQRCSEENLYFEIFSQDLAHSVSKEDFKRVLKDIAETANPLVPAEELSERAERRFQEENVQITDDFEKLLKNKELNFYKVLAFSLDKDVLAKLASEFQEEPSVAVTASGDINIEFNHIDAQKGYAVEQFAKRLGIDMEDVMTLGDHFNDESMIRMAGRGVAMGNADDAIKEIATHTTKSNIEDGFAYAVEKMLEDIS